MITPTPGRDHDHDMGDYPAPGPGPIIPTGGITLDHFDLMAVIGRGSYAKVGSFVHFLFYFVALIFLYSIDRSCTFRFMSFVKLRVFIFKIATR